MSRIFVTTEAVDGFDAGTEWTYQKIQKQFGPRRFAEMKAAGTMLAYDEAEYEAMKADADAATVASLPSGARGAALGPEYDTDGTYVGPCDVDCDEHGDVPASTDLTGDDPASYVTTKPDHDAFVEANRKEARRLSAKRRAERLRAERADRLTPAQVQAMLAVDALQRSGSLARAADVADGMGLAGQAIRVSGFLSSLKEKGALTTSRVKGGGVAYEVTPRGRELLEAAGV